MFLGGKVIALQPYNKQFIDLACSVCTVKYWTLRYRPHTDLADKNIAKWYNCSEMPKYFQYVKEIFEFTFGFSVISVFRVQYIYYYPRRDSNPQPLNQTSNALIADPTLDHFFNFSRNLSKEKVNLFLYLEVTLRLTSLRIYVLLMWAGRHRIA